MSTTTAPAEAHARGVADDAAPIAAVPPRPAVAARHRRRDWVTRRALAASDALAVGAALALVAALDVGGPGLTGGQAVVALATLPGFILLLRAYGLYEGDVRRLSHTTIDDVPPLVQALLAGTVLLWVVLRLADGQPVAFGTLLAFGVTAGVGALLLRLVVRPALLAALGPERVLLIGDGPEIPALVRKLRTHPEYGVELVGLVSRTGAQPGPHGVPVLCAVAALDLDAAVRVHGVERVIVARLDGDAPAGHPDLNRVARLDILRRCKELSLRVGVVPQLYDALGPSVVVDDIEGVTVLDVPAPVLSRSSRALKRATDLLVGGLALIVAAPALVLLAVAIRLDSPGPVLFRQRRVGRGGRTFRIVKLRTMVADAERQHAALRALSRDAHWLHLDHDPRVTRIGRFLRHTSLDELPQLWNVVRGEMSLVGPRPIVESEDVQLEGWRRNRVDLKPGLTGLWQILGRTEIPFEEMVKLDYLYVTNWSLWNDVRLLLRTVPIVLLRRGAN